MWFCSSLDTQHELGRASGEPIQHTWLLADARKTEEVGYAERLANVLILDRTAPKLVPAGLSLVYTRKSKSKCTHKY